MKIFGTKTTNLLFIFKIDTLAKISLTCEISFFLFFTLSLAIESMRYNINFLTLLVSSFPCFSSFFPLWRVTCSWNPRLDTNSFSLTTIDPKHVLLNCTPLFFDKFFGIFVDINKSQWMNNILSVMKAKKRKKDLSVVCCIASNRSHPCSIMVYHFSTERKILNKRIQWNQQ